jgi:hypothetical protein
MRKNNIGNNNMLQTLLKQTAHKAPNNKRTINKDNNIMAFICKLQTSVMHCVRRIKLQNWPHIFKMPKNLAQQAVLAKWHKRFCCVFIKNPSHTKTA